MYRAKRTGNPSLPGAPGHFTSTHQAQPPAETNHHCAAARLWCPVLGVDGVDVVGDHARPVALVVVDGVAVLGGLARAAGEGVAVLPEHVAGNALGGQGGRLPRVLDRAVVAAAVFCDRVSLISLSRKSSLCG